MAAYSDEVTRTTENIAAISDENAATIEHSAHGDNGRSPGHSFLAEEVVTGSGFEANAS